MINKDQEEIIKNAKLPAYVLAGPGTGKTHTIVNFVAEEIKRGRFSPNKILITTFTKKAARELNTRIISKLKQDKLNVDLKNMMIGNFHSLAIDFIKKFRKLDDKFFSLTVIDSNMEEYLLMENIELFTSLEGFSDLIQGNPTSKVLEIFESIINNLLDLQALKESEDARDRLAYAIYRTYEGLLDRLGLINFQLILKRFHDLLADPLIGEKIRGEIDLVVVDEYQDTNLIQEEIAFNLGNKGNIIVFGDDDQALYSFRGASANNLLDFDQRFYQKTGLRSTAYKLMINYRSNQFIVAKAKTFIDKVKPTGKKDLMAVDQVENPNTIVRARAENIGNIVAIVNHLTKKIKAKQIAFLFPSFYNDFPSTLQLALEKSGLRVINRKSDQYFYRKEIRLMVYILLKYAGVDKIHLDFSGQKDWKKNKYRKYLASILEDENLGANDEIRDFLNKLGEGEKLSAIVYRALGLDFHQKIIGWAKDESAKMRIQKNIGKFLSLCVDFDDIFTYQESSKLKFIFSYLYVYYKNNALAEYDEEDSFEDGVNFMTIHQAKGLEFDVVFVSSLNDYPRGFGEKFLEKYERKPSSDQDQLDFYRKYYTAFTRAKNLLVVFDNSRDKRIKAFANSLDSSSNLSTIAFKKEAEKKDKPILAYTTDIAIYHTCPQKYLFLRKLSYKTHKTKSLTFGSRVHALAEYLYSDNFIKDDMKAFLEKNPAYIASISNLLNMGFDVRNSEANYKADRDFYILQGSLDLILKDGTIIDLKTGSFDEKALEKYKGQLITYKNLMKENGENPTGMLLYFIEKDQEIRVEEEDFDIFAIDRIARNIVDENFNEKTTDKGECKLCPMRFYCKRACI